MIGHRHMDSMLPKSCVRDLSPAASICRHSGIMRFLTFLLRLLLSRAPASGPAEGSAPRAGSPEQAAGEGLAPVPARMHAQHDHM